jgi:hypothetical protein
MKSSELLLGYPKSSYEIVRALAFLCVDEIARHCGKANQTSSITTWHRPEYSRSGKPREDLNH